MFICICNAVNQRRIQTAIDQGSATVDCVYAACGVEPKCRSCAEAIQDMIDGRASGGMGAGCGIGFTAAAAPAE